MYNIAIGLASGAVVFLAVMLGLSWSAWASILPGLFVAVLVYVVLVRRTMAQVQALMERVNKAVIAQKPDRAVQLLKEGMWLSRWQPLVGRQIKGQIGQLTYIRGEPDDALPWLRESWVRDHMSQAMLAACLYRKKSYPEMEAVLAKASSVNKKQAFMWGIYAYLLDRIGKRDEAIKRLSEGLESCPGDENLQANLLLLQNGKRMKMKRFGDMWYGFKLEAMPVRHATPRFAAFRR